MRCSPLVFCAARLCSVSLLCSLVMLLGLLACVPSGVAADDDYAELYASIRKAVADKETVLVKPHSLHNTNFEELYSDGVLLTGMVLGIGKFFDKEEIYAVRGIYRKRDGSTFEGNMYGLFTDKKEFKKTTKSKVERTATVNARSGYAVGGISIHTGLFVDMLSIQFMRIKGTRLDPKDSYSSDIYGNVLARPGQAIGGTGAPMVGICGVKDDHIVNRLGLIAVKTAPAPVAPPKVDPRPKNPDPPPVQPEPKLPVQPPVVEPKIDLNPVLPPAQPSTQPKEATLPPATVPPATVPSSGGDDASLSMMVFGGIFLAVTLPIFTLMYFVLKPKQATPLLQPTVERPRQAAPTMTAAAPLAPLSAPPPVPAPPKVNEDITAKPLFAALPDLAPMPSLDPTPEEMDEVVPLQRTPLSAVTAPRVGFGLRVGAQIIDAAAILLSGLLIAIVGGMIGATAGAGVGSKISITPPAVPKQPTPPGSRQPYPSVQSPPPEAGLVAGGFLGGVFGAFGALMVAMPLISLGFFFWEGLTGAALGKRILKIRVRTADGHPAATDKLLLRAALKHSPQLIRLIALVPFLLSIGYASMIIGGVTNLVATLAGLAIFIGCFLVLTDKRQALHDMAADTAVYPENALAGGGAR